tara:strand:+ start:42 stop:941 length:900 start_codon:yes stop_codon:yes gene_type:complete
MVKILSMVPITMFSEVIKKSASRAAPESKIGHRLLPGSSNKSMLSNSADFNRTWNKSNQSRRMLTESLQNEYKNQTGVRGLINRIIGPGVSNLAANIQANRIIKQRNKNLKGVTISENGFEDGSGTLADYDNITKNIRLNLKDYPSQDVKGSIDHEIGHASVDYNDNSRIPLEDSKYIKDTFKNRTKKATMLPPWDDENLMNDYFDIKAVENIYGQDTPGSNEHVRIKLMRDRQYLYEQGHDVMNKKITDEMMDVLEKKDVTKDLGVGKRAPKVFGRNNWKNLLNTVADNTKTGNNNYT